MDLRHRAVTHPISPKSGDLFNTMHEQTQRVLGASCGFFVITYDSDRDVARLAYFVDGSNVSAPAVLFSAAHCEAIMARRAVINDGFARIVSHDVVNSITVPMVRHGVILGAFGAFASEERVYDERDAKALEAIAELGALALENARYLVEIQKARKESERLEEIGRAISGSLELSKVLERIVEAAIDLVEADTATVWLKCGERELEAAMTAGLSGPSLGLRIPIGLHELNTIGATVSVPLEADGQLLGALSVTHDARMRFSLSDTRLLERLSYQAAIAVANARLHERLHALSLTDPLTEMPNRRHLDIFLAKEFEAARRGRQVSVLLFDLDHFKEYNDRRGHQAGDDVLRNFARILVAHTRKMNLAARYGGDEFITILADTDTYGARAHAERMMREIERDPALRRAGVRASVGVASYDTSMDSFEDLIRAADSDLYLRKAARGAIYSGKSPGPG